LEETVDGAESSDGEDQGDVSNVRAVGETRDAHRIMSGVMTWPARTRENDADAAPDINVMMSWPRITLAFIDTGVVELPVQEEQREPLM
jgi:hypothetical protein